MIRTRRLSIARIAPDLGLPDSPERSPLLKPLHALLSGAGALVGLFARAAVLIAAVSLFAVLALVGTILDKLGPEEF